MDKNKITFIKGTVSQNLAVMHNMFGLYKFIDYVINTDISEGDKTELTKFRKHINAQLTYNMTHMTKFLGDRLNLIKNLDKSLATDIITWPPFLDMTEVIMKSDTNKQIIDMIPYKFGPNVELVKLENLVMRVIDTLSGTSKPFNNDIRIEEFHDNIIQCNTLAGKVFYIYSQIVHQTSCLKDILSKIIKEDNGYEPIERDFNTGVGYASFLTLDMLLHNAILDYDKNDKKIIDTIEYTRKYINEAVMRSFRTLAASKLINKIPGITLQSTPVDLFKAIVDPKTPASKYKVSMCEYGVFEDDYTGIVQLTLLFNYTESGKDIEFAEVISHDIDDLGFDNFWHNMNRWIFSEIDVTANEKAIAKFIFDRVREETANNTMLEASLLTSKLSDDMFNNDDITDIISSKLNDIENTNIEDEPASGYWN